MPVSKQGVAHALHIMIEFNVDSDFIAKLSAAIQITNLNDIDISISCLYIRICHAFIT